MCSCRKTRTCPLMERKVKELKDEDWMTQDEWYQIRGVNSLLTGPAGTGFFVNIELKSSRPDVSAFFRAEGAIVRPSWLEQVIDDLAVHEANARFSQIFKDPLKNWGLWS